MGNTWNQEAHDPSLIFVSLLYLELAWNACRTILVCISVRYYLELIKEIRQTPTIRLSDFTDNAANELDQEFHDEMMNEYPGYGHKDNIVWYCTNTASFITTMVLDLWAVLSIYFENYFALQFWICVYFGFSISEVAITVFLMKRCTNRTYFKRKCGHTVVTFVGCTAFRLYLIWLCKDMPF